MAINTSDVGGAFSALLGDVKGVLDEQYDNSRIDTAGYALILSESIKGAQASAVELYLRDKLTDADIAVKTQQIAESVARVTREAAESAKELLVKDKDIAVKTQQIAESVARVTNDNTLNAARVSLTARQTTALDDAKKVKKAELLGNTVSMIESGGNVAPAATWTAFNEAVDGI